MMANVGWMMVGLLLLHGGAEGVVRGGSRLAIRLGITPLAVGLTVVAFGTSAPELAVSVKASLAGRGDLAAGNVVGSNLCNLALILGLCVCVRPLSAGVNVVRRDLPVLVGSSVLVLVLASDGRLGRWEGGVLVMGLLAYTLGTLAHARSRSEEALRARALAMEAMGRQPLVQTLAVVAGGLLMLVFGGRFLVEGAVGVARGYGLNEAFIGLTIVAMGTSLPELATSLIASLKNQDDISIGNLVGSSLFNLLGILGASAWVHPLELHGIRPVDWGAMLGVTLILWPLLVTEGRVSRREGVLLLAAYAVYLGWLLPKGGGG